MRLSVYYVCIYFTDAWTAAAMTVFSVIADHLMFIYTLFELMLELCRIYFLRFSMCGNIIDGDFNGYW